MWSLVMQLCSNNLNCKLRHVNKREPQVVRKNVSEIQCPVLLASELGVTQPPLAMGSRLLQAAAGETQVTPAQLPDQES